MITYVSGDLLQSEAQTLVNATNTEGVMGGGIALAFARAYPEMLAEYRAACAEGFHTVTQPHLWRGEEHWVLNLATKDLIVNDSTTANITAGLSWIVQNYVHEGIKSLAVPALGCGLGGCSWDDVSSLIHLALQPLPIPVEVYLPRG